MAYEKYRADWHDGPAGGTEIDSDAMDHIELGIFDAAAVADQAVADAAAAQEDADQGIADAATAQAAAEAAQQSADDAQTAADAAQTDATQALSDAADAQQAADGAQEAADTAQETAERAAVVMRSRTGAGTALVNSNNYQLLMHLPALEVPEWAETMDMYFWAAGMMAQNAVASIQYRVQNTNTEDVLSPVHSNHWNAEDLRGPLAGGADDVDVSQWQGQTIPIQIAARKTNQQGNLFADTACRSGYVVTFHGA